MSFNLDAVKRCENYVIDPKIGFRSQYVIAPLDRGYIPGMKKLSLKKWALHHGERLKPIALIDQKDRVFGAFLGVGIDKDGATITAASFSRFNSKGRSFHTDLQDYLSGIAGRYLVVIDSGSKSCICRDPLGQMPVFFNSKTQLAASCIYLVLERPVSMNPACTRPGDPTSTPSVFPMGQTADIDVRLMHGNHALDLTEFSANRAWPLRNTIRKVPATKAGPVIEKMAKRLRQVVQGLIEGTDVTLPLDAGIGSRILLAAAGDKAGKIGKVCTLQPGKDEDANTLAVARLVAKAAGIPVTPLTRNAAADAFGNTKVMRHERRRTYWIRTSTSIRMPREAAVGVLELLPQDHVVLDTAGLAALQGGWRAGDARPKPMRSSVSSEISGALKRKVDRATRDAVAKDYSNWKASLPKSLYGQTEDFIRLELHETAQAIGLLGYGDHILACPFSDRAFIELALKLPLALRSGEKFAEALIAALNPDLAGLPYQAEALPDGTKAVLPNSLAIDQASA